ncbi:MAG: DUF1707 SHOCT-like domain-containing protein [Solirubrobacteraceae bacterium]
MAGRAILRASDSDREQIIDRLRKAAAEGRLAAHELEDRVGAALRARTYGDLDATVADLPRQARSRLPAARPRLALARQHPLLLVLAVPVILTAVALVAAVTLAAMVMMFVLFVLTRRPLVYALPWGCSLHRYHRHVRSRARGYWA